MCYYAECRYAECHLCLVSKLSLLLSHYAECRHADCRGTFDNIFFAVFHRNVLFQGFSFKLITSHPG
jgi:hypothetical protein